MDAAGAGRLLGRIAIVAALLMCGLESGCAPAKSKWLSPNEWRLAPAEPLSERTLTTLHRHHVAAPKEGKELEAVAKLQESGSNDASTETLFAIAEVAHRGGLAAHEKDSKLALELYSTSIVHSWRGIFQTQAEAPSEGPALASLEVRHALNDTEAFDPRFRQACAMYNTALENALRLIVGRQLLAPGKKLTVETAARKLEVEVVWRSNTWRDDEFVKFEFVSDYNANQKLAQHRSFGLGVPLIAVRQRRQGNDQLERHYPPQLGVPATAFLRLLPDDDPLAAAQGRYRGAVLELYDPLATPEIDVAGAKVPLESDFGTPLAWLLEQANLPKLAFTGLLNPEEGQKLRGLYMLEPFNPQKIPVIMVHGLASAPSTWVEMFNELRAARAIREHYQVWFYLYPTGQPFWETAAQMRHDLADLREAVDPKGRIAALDQTVLIGHSMGGLISKLQVLDSGEDYWRIVSDKPFHLVSASEETRQRLEDVFFFERNPSIRRIITLGTPHRGSRFANGMTRWLGEKLIQLPETALQGRDQFLAQNPGLVRDPRLLSIRTSIDSLAPESPIFPVMLTSQRPESVKHHNVVGVLKSPRAWHLIYGEGDGVVTYASAHLEDVDSELVVDADHTGVHRHPLAIREVRRILLEHLTETRHFLSFDPMLAARPE